MKTDVITILKDQELTPNQKFNKLLKIFLAQPSHGRSQARHYNMRGFTEATLSSLTYDVKKLFGITDIELVSKKVPITAKLTLQEKLALIDLTDISAIEKFELIQKFNTISKVDELTPANLPQFSKGTEGTEEMKAWLTAREVKFTATNKKDLSVVVDQVQNSFLDKAFEDAFKNLEIAQESAAAVAPTQEEIEAEETKQRGIVITNTTKVFADAPDDVKAGIKFRNEFPFLAEADCPDQLKILAADKITAFQNFTESREELKKLISEKKQDILFEAAAAAVENFELNLEIYDELNYYKEHKEILGNHAIFADMMLERAVADYKEVDLKQIRANLRSTRSQQRSKLKKSKKGVDTSGINATILEIEKEIALIDKRLGDDK